MTDPQPHHLKPKPQRAEPWQPDKLVNDGEPVADKEPSHDVPATPKRVVASYDRLQDTAAAVSSEAAIPRDPQTGQALSDESLTSGKDSEQSDGRSGSMHLPES